MEYRTSGNIRGFIWIMDIAAGWTLLGVLLLCDWVMFVLIDGFFEEDIEGVRYEK